MKIDIIVAYIQRYTFGHEKNFVPPITGIYLAALLSQQHDVRVFHQQVDTIDLSSDADVVAISFFSGFAQEAFRLAAAFKQRGKIVIAGGPHVTFSVQESLAHFDAVIIGEAESVWQQVLDDIEHGSLQQTYQGKTPDLAHLPTPRYDLLSEKFFIKKVIQATRGCPYSCTFCTVPVL
ncbi:MAG: radical SAM protein, partial [Candidatus Electrothrix sp. ATG2]|nr:radical SAM protein [Candidatus Electrothrix sp. ATG2]